MWRKQFFLRPDLRKMASHGNFININRGMVGLNHLDPEHLNDQWRQDTFKRCCIYIAAPDINTKEIGSIMISESYKSQTDLL